MKLVVAATDFSPLAEAAARRAGCLADATGARVALLHVLERRGLAYHLGGAARATLRLAAERLRSQYDVRVDEYLAHGTPHAQIAAFAAQARADLVVLGLRSGRVGTLLGHATAQRVRRRIAAPVLAVRRQEASGYERVLATTDLSTASAAALARLAPVLAQAQVHLLHVCPPGFEGELPPGRPGSIARRLHRHQALRRAGRELWHFAYRSGLGRARLQLELGDPAQVIRERAADLRAELLVLASATKPGLASLLFGSVTDAVLARTACDALVVGQRSGVEGEVPELPGIGTIRLRSRPFAEMRMEAVEGRPVHRP